MTRRPNSLRLGLIPMAVLIATSPTWAQQPTDGALQTINITATKRVQPLQETPIAISVLGGGDLEAANLNNLSLITQQTPSVNFRANASNKDSSLFIRGVGTISTSPGVEPTVSLALDGVVTARPGQATLDLVDVERIEILRGPQGTLFGKNASAGAISIVSKAPGKATERYIDLSLFQGGETRVRAGVSGELAKDFARASLGVIAGKYDGNITNVFDGSTVNGYDRKGIRGRLDLTPNRSLKITLIADYSKNTDTTPTGVAYSTTITTYPTNAQTARNDFADALLPVVASPTNRQINSEMKTRVNDTNQGVSAQVDWTIGDPQITSITAQRGWKNTAFQDQDRLSSVSRGIPQQADEAKLDFSQTSQELRIASTKKQGFEYVAGLFYLEAKNDEVYRRDVTRCLATTTPARPSGLVPCSPGSLTVDTGLATYGIRIKNQALFGEGTFHISPTLRAVAGLRYTEDQLSYYHGRTSTATGGITGIQPTRAQVNGSTTENAWSGRVGPQWILSKDVMVYATASKGYKGPAFNVFFNMQPLQDNVLAPEKSTSYEVGLKSELMDRRLRLNLAAFKTDYTSFQANVPELLGGSIITRLINAGDVGTKGVEIDLTARITPDFSVNAGVANIIARIKNFNCPPGAPLSCDVNGKPLAYSPDWKASVSARYTMPVAGKLNADFNGNLTWQSRTNFEITQQPDSFQPAYSIVNASVSLYNADAGWRLTLIGKNLGDKSYATLVQSTGSHINRYVPRDDRRYFGVNLRYDF